MSYFKNLPRHQHGGNLQRLSNKAAIPQSEILDFSANINPLGPPEWLRSLISSRISNLSHYPDPAATELVEALAALHQINVDQILVGNGATELLHLLPRALNYTRLLIPVPCYADYEEPFLLNGLEIEHLPLSDENDFDLDLKRLVPLLQPSQMVILGQPNNPTGQIFQAETLRQIAADHPKTLFVVDESFIGFTDESQSLQQRRPDNVLVITSLTKLYAIPGLRLGYLTGLPFILRQLRSYLPNWTVNTLAQAVGAQAVQDHEYQQRTRRYVQLQRQELVSMLAAIPCLKIFPGEANFLLLRLEHPTMNASQLASLALQKGIALRVCDNFYALDHRYFRVAVRTEPEQQQLCQLLRNILDHTNLVRQTSQSVQDKTPNSF